MDEYGADSLYDLYPIPEEQAEEFLAVAWDGDLDVPEDILEGSLLDFASQRPREDSDGESRDGCARRKGSSGSSSGEETFASHPALVHLEKMMGPKLYEALLGYAPSKSGLRCCDAHGGVPCVFHILFGAGKLSAGLVVAMSLLRRRLHVSGAAKAAGVFVASSRALDCFSRAYFERVFPAANAAVSGSAFLLIYGEKGRGALVSQAVVRAAMVLYRYFVEASIIPQIPHGEILVNCLFLCRLCSAWALSPSTIDPSALRTLDRYSALPRGTLAHVRRGLADNTLDNMCMALHPWTRSCMRHATAVNFPRTFRRSMTVNLPIHILSSGVLKWKQWIYGVPSRPSLTDALGRFLRSCLFLTSAFQLPMLMACYTASLSNQKQVRRLGFGLGGLLGGTCLFLEDKNKRPAIASYVAAHGLLSLYNSFMVRARIGNATRTVLAHAIFGSALAILFADRSTLPKIVMRIVFGCSHKQVLRNRNRRVSSSCIKPPTSDHQTQEPNK